MSIDSNEALQQKREKAARHALRQREWLALLVFFMLVLLVAFNFKRVEVKGHSMEPTYHNGAIVIVWKASPRSALKPGDVIVFRSSDGDELIKRIVFIGGPNSAGHYPPPGFPAVVRTPYGPIDPAYGFDDYFLTVTDGRSQMPDPHQTIYVMGDNYKFSDDSRDFGPINPNQILGKVLP